MKYWILLFLLSAYFTGTFGQTIDQSKMDKDLEVAENILSTLLKQSSSDEFMYLSRGQKVEGNYLANYGVVFSVESSGFRFYNVESKGKEFESVEMAVAGEIEPSEMVIQAFKDFLADYGNLIRQLKPSDKILLKTGGTRHSRGGVVVFNGQKKTKMTGGISAELNVSDLSSYEKGNLTRDELMDKIEINEDLNSAVKEPQLEVFSSMLERLYEVDLTNTYYMSGTPDYDRLEKFGVTYYLKFYSSLIHDNDEYSLPTIDKKHVSKAERNKIVEEMYPEFLKTFKQNVLDYGHILRTLDPEEMIVFHIKLTSCEGCDMPAVIDVSLKKSVIEDYRNGDLTLDRAMTMIEVKDVSD